MTNMSSPAEHQIDFSGIANLAGLEPSALELIAAKRTEREAFEQLLRGGLHADAIRFLAHLLPRREAVWWAWVSVRKSAAGEQSQNQKACLEATERWLASPTDDHRRAAFASAEKAQFGTPAGCVGLAAFLSGDSLAPAGLQAVPPEEHLAGRAVANAMLMAAVAQAPEKAPERLKGFLEQGTQLAERIQLWRKREG
jgi:hypothetical protein